MLEQQVRLSDKTMVCENYEIFDLYRGGIKAFGVLW
jgi:hypothetical protein